MENGKTQNYAELKAYKFILFLYKRNLPLTLSKWSNSIHRICCSSFWSSSIVSCKSIRPAISNAKSSMGASGTRKVIFYRDVLNEDVFFCHLVIHTHKHQNKKKGTMLSTSSQGTRWESRMNWSGRNGSIMIYLKQRYDGASTCSLEIFLKSVLGLMFVQKSIPI